MESKTVEKIVITASPETIADLIAQHFQGIPPVMLDTVSLDEKTIKRIGCTVATIEVARVHDDSTMIKKHRATQETNPFLAGSRVTEKYTVQVLLNAIYQNALANRGSEYMAEETRRNGIQNVGDSRVVCVKEVKGETRFYLNYIILRYIGDMILVDSEGREVDQEYFDGFLKTPKKQKQENREKTADLHGLSIEIDPQIRQMKLTNVGVISLLGMKYKPMQITVEMNKNVQNAAGIK